MHSSIYFFRFRCLFYIHFLLISAIFMALAKEYDISFSNPAHKCLFSVQLGGGTAIDEHKARPSFSHPSNFILKNYFLLKKRSLWKDSDVCGYLE